MREQRFAVPGLSQALDGRVRLWSEGTKAHDHGAAMTGVKRCLQLLDKLREGAEKLTEVETGAENCL